MIDSIKNFVTGYEFLSFLALLTYWIPLAICSITYTFRFVHYYKVDLTNCEKMHYQPNLTIGAIIGHIILAATPCVNIFALVFDCAGSVFGWLGRTFDMPLVRARYIPEQK